MLKNKYFYPIIYQKIAENLMEIAKDKIGTYSLQGIIDNLKYKEEKKIFIDRLSDKVVEMSLVNI